MLERTIVQYRTRLGLHTLATIARYLRMISRDALHVSAYAADHAELGCQEGVTTACMHQQKTQAHSTVDGGRLLLAIWTRLYAAAIGKAGPTAAIGIEGIGEHTMRSKDMAEVFHASCCCGGCGSTRDPNVLHAMRLLICIQHTICTFVLSLRWQPCVSMNCALNVKKHHLCETYCHVRRRWQRDACHCAHPHVFDCSFSCLALIGRLQHGGPSESPHVFGHETTQHGKHITYAHTCGRVVNTPAASPTIMAARAGDMLRSAAAKHC